MPVLFVAHGAPILLDDAQWMAELTTWSKNLPKPRAILMISAHWEQRPASLGATTPVPLIHDFYGFPQRYYQTQYPAPGAPDLAKRVHEILKDKKIPAADDPARGLDHGAYVPLIPMFPNADIPVLQLSMPRLDPLELFNLGKALAPLRAEQILIFASGFITHNMQYAFKPGIPQWAKEFDHWTQTALAGFNPDALIQFQSQAPAAHLALPTWEHFAPLLIAAGAAANPSPQITFPITGWWMNTAFTKRSVQFDA